MKNKLSKKEVKISDSRLYINTKYYPLMDNNYSRRNYSRFELMNLQINHQDSILIVNSAINDINKDNYKNEVLNKCNSNILKMLDIYSFDNDKKEKNKKIKSEDISFSFKECTRLKEESIYNKVINERLINFLNILKNKIIVNIRKYLYNKYKIRILLMKIINNYKRKIIKSYFSKYKNIINNNQNKIDINNCGIYHKINYNDDFNLNKKLKTTKNNQKNDNSKNIQCKTKPHNLTLKNSFKRLNNKKLGNKKRVKEFSPNNNNICAIMNKKINIIVHNNTKLKIVI
jgi:hypothetical protein